MAVVTETAPDIGCQAVGIHTRMVDGRRSAHWRCGGSCYDMHMSLSRRVQILVDDDQYRRVEREADRRGGSVASVVRDAIDRLLPGDSHLDRTAAGDLLLEAEPIDWGKWDDRDDLLADIAPLDTSP